MNKNEPKEPDVVPLDDPSVPESLVPIPPADPVPASAVPQPDFWRCKTCGCLWRDNHVYDHDSVSLGSAKQTSCVDCEMKPTAEACEPLYRSAAPLLPQAWEPIETAPKDGTVVALWDDRQHVAFTGFWGREPFRVSERWRSNGDSVNPTHWMPLPPAPPLDRKEPT